MFSTTSLMYSVADHGSVADLDPDAGHDADADHGSVADLDPDAGHVSDADHVPVAGHVPVADHVPDANHKQLFFDPTHQPKVVFKNDYKFVAPNHRLFETGHPIVVVSTPIDPLTKKSISWFLHLPPNPGDNIISFGVVSSKDASEAPNYKQCPYPFLFQNDGYFVDGKFISYALPLYESNDTVSVTLCDDTMTLSVKGRVVCTIPGLPSGLVYPAVVLYNTNQTFEFLESPSSVPYTEPYQYVQPFNCIVSFMKTKIPEGGKMTSLHVQLMNQHADGRASKSPAAPNTAKFLTPYYDRIKDALRPAFTTFPLTVCVQSYKTVCIMLHEEACSLGKCEKKHTAFEKSMTEATTLEACWKVLQRPSVPDN